MLSTALPTRIELPFANSGTKNTIPVPSQIAITPGAASYTDGFPPLTFTAISAGGIPPDGADMNGILNAITAIQQWQSAGGLFKFDATFAAAIGGYPAGAVLLSTDNVTQWLNLVDSNTLDPDGGSAGGTYLSLNGPHGITAITGLAATNVTLTSTQYKNPVITLAGTLTGNIQIIFPTTQQNWTVINNTTGAFSITCKTSAGTGVIVQQGAAAQLYGDGTNIATYTMQNNGGPVKGSAVNYVASAIGINNYNTVVTADEATLENSYGQYRTVRAVNLTINANGTVGAPLSIMSARAASTWYYVWLWYNASLGLTATLDVSSTAPTAPTGYASTDYNARMPGAVRTDASGSTYLLQTLTKDKATRYIPLAGSNTTSPPLMASGTSAGANVGVGSFVPPTAARISLILSGLLGANFSFVAPDSTYGSAAGVNCAPIYIVNAAAAAASIANSGELVLEGAYPQNVYWYAGGTSYLTCYGWNDN